MFRHVTSKMAEMREVYNLTMNSTLHVGVLAIQGAFAEHAHHLKLAFDAIKSSDGLLNVTDMEVIEVRKVEQLQGLDGLVLPGGESTTMSKFLDKNGFMEGISDLVLGQGEKPAVVWGTCAGLILLSKHVEDMKTGGQTILGGLDVSTSRNAYGRQFESFEAKISLHDPDLKSSKETSSETCPGVFIRAPQIMTVDEKSVQILATISRNDNERIVAVRQGHLIGTSFHPELTDDYRWHTYFLKSIIGSSLDSS